MRRWTRQGKRVGEWGKGERVKETFVYGSAGGMAGSCVCGARATITGERCSAVALVSVLF